MIHSVLTLSDDSGGASHDGVLEESVSAQRLNGTGLGVPSMLVGLLDPHLLTVQVLHHSLGILHKLLHILDNKKIKPSLTNLPPSGFFTHLITKRRYTIMEFTFVELQRERE